MVAPRATQRSSTPTFGIDTALTTPTWGWFSVPGATLRARPNHGMNSAGRLFRLLLPPLDDLDRPRQCSTVAPRQREVYLDHALRLSQVGGSRSVLIVATNFRLRPPPQTSQRRRPVPPHALQLPSGIPTMDLLPVPRHARQEVVLWPWHLGHNVLFGIARFPSL